MDDLLTTITLDGVQYYISYDNLSHLSFVDGYLINNSNSSFTIKKTFNPNSQTGSNVITCPSMSVCYWRSTGTSSTYNYINKNYTYDGDQFMLINYGRYIFILLFIILGVKLVWKR